jgi:glycosyltransferase involved in cell wall biosynthesis|tara:strand:- start:106 stop:1113 length:1008 start_codon:yes stop_codon:yes gene_type:complete
MKILIATDAYYPQVNGVVRTLHETGEILKSQGHTIEYLTPQLFLTFPMPKYNEIRLSVNVWPRVGSLIKQLNPDAIHIATEGPIGTMARRYCIKNNLKFTTSFHTRFDKYLKLYLPIIPSKWAEKFLANFHNKAERILVTTETMRKELIDIGIDNKKMVTWTRGGNHGAFKNPNKIDLPHKRPIWIYVGRVAIEKNIRAFLELELEGTKIIIGKGPDLKKLKKEFPNDHFLGEKTNGELASHFASSDVFVFPSKTDTFGIVVLESLNCGTPVAAYPVPGPLDILGGTEIDTLDEDLKTSALKALKISREDCLKFAKKYSWEETARIFFDNISPNN